MEGRAGGEVDQVAASVVIGPRTRSIILTLPAHPSLEGSFQICSSLYSCRELELGKHRCVRPQAACSTCKVLVSCMLQGPSWSLEYARHGGVQDRLRGNALRDRDTMKPSTERALAIATVVVERQAALVPHGGGTLSMLSRFGSLPR